MSQVSGSTPTKDFVYKGLPTYWPICNISEAESERVIENLFKENTMGISTGTFIVIDQIFALIEVGFKAQEIKSKLDVMRADGKSEANVSMALDAMLNDAEKNAQAIIDKVRAAKQINSDTADMSSDR